MRNPARHGFTLLELMLVMGIVSIIAVTAGPALSRLLNTSRTTSAARDLQSFSKRARMLTIWTGVPHGVYLAGNTAPARPGQLVLYRKRLPSEAPSPFNSGGDPVVEFVTLTGGLLPLTVPSIASSNSMSLYFDIRGLPTLTYNGSNQDPTTTPYDVNFTLSTSTTIARIGALGTVELP